MYGRPCNFFSNSCSLDPSSVTWGAMEGGVSSAKMKLETKNSNGYFFSVAKNNKEFVTLECPTNLCQWDQHVNKLVQDRQDWLVGLK